MISLSTLLILLPQWAQAHQPTLCAQKNATPSRFTQLYGKTPPTTLYLGMWTLHFRWAMNASQHHDEWRNQLIGVNYKSLFAGTLINSYDERSYVVGLQRDLLQHDYQNSHWSVNAGYRLGLIYGYKSGEVFSLSNYTPILPFPQLYAQFSYKHRVGIELSYTLILISATLYIRL